ncbi:PD40 domain-containing protein [candidate division KSB1 bacterium]|nr:PD40 domain-containing protein [candidate division KSB1 bacterium]
MKLKHIYYTVFLLLIGLVFTGINCTFVKNPGLKAQRVDKLPVIDPDYTNTVIPPNIAPLNFRVDEPGRQYYVKIYSLSGDTIHIMGKMNRIIIPRNEWKELLTTNKGQNYFVDIFVKEERGQWLQYKTISNKIAPEEIDSHLAYRLINPAFRYWKKMGIYQRDLESYKETPILLNRMTDGNCMNCHNFCMNSADKMIFHMRAGKGSGMMLYHDGELVKVNTATDFSRAGAYPAWHPNGKVLALSSNTLKMYYHSIGESRDVIDFKADLIIYLIESNMVTTNPNIADPEYVETFPCWSPDGKYLYFCRAPKLENYFFTRNDGQEDLAYDKILFDLMRIGYDSKSGTWGELETVISSENSGFSVALPRVSPDNRYVMFTISRYGSFPIYHSFSDIYILDLAAGEYRKLGSNSESTDSFHSWSKNGRWYVFSSKRKDEVCARPYFSYFDESGRDYKPFILPQKDPVFYETFFKTYNVPELFMGPFKVRPQEMVKVAYNQKATLNASLDPDVKVKQRNEPETSIYQSAQR